MVGESNAERLTYNDSSCRQCLHLETHIELACSGGRVGVDQRNADA